MRRDRNAPRKWGSISDSGTMQMPTTTRKKVSQHENRNAKIIEENLLNVNRTESDLLVQGKKTKVDGRGVNQ